MTSTTRFAAKPPAEGETPRQAPLEDLELSKETVQDLTPAQAERAQGGFIMRDTVIVRTSGR
jgi:hypothetical protein